MSDRLAVLRAILGSDWAEFLHRLAEDLSQQRPALAGGQAGAAEVARAAHVLVALFGTVGATAAAAQARALQTRAEAGTAMPAETAVLLAALDALLHRLGTAAA